MSRRPSFQFYPADWFANPNLKRCSHAEKGMWMDILCLLHDGHRYGVLRWSLAEIARSIGATVAAVSGLVRKGVLKGSDTHCEALVYVPRSGRKDGAPVTLIEEQDGPIWYSSRMVTDEYKSVLYGGKARTDRQEGQPPLLAKVDGESERVRLRKRVWNKTNGLCHHCGVGLDDNWEMDHFIPRARGGMHTISNLVPSCPACNRDKSDTMPDDWVPLGSSPRYRQGERQGDVIDTHPSRAAPSSSTSSTGKKEDPVADATVVRPPPKSPSPGESEFQEFYDAYPLHKARGAALKAYLSARKKGVSHEILVRGAANYVDHCRRAGTEKRFIAHPATWLNAERWNDDLSEHGGNPGGYPAGRSGGNGPCRLGPVGVARKIIADLDLDAEDRGLRDGIHDDGFLDYGPVGS